MLSSQEITILISVCALALSFYFGMRTQHHTDQKDTADAASQTSAIMIKLESIQTDLIEVKTDMKSHKAEVQRVNEQTVRNEESLKSLHKRVDRIEKILETGKESE